MHLDELKENSGRSCHLGLDFYGSVILATTFSVLANMAVRKFGIFLFSVIKGYFIDGFRRPRHFSANPLELFIFFSVILKLVYFLLATLKPVI